jgi:hypothetical protein
MGTVNILAPANGTADGSGMSEAEAVWPLEGVADPCDAAFRFLTFNWLEWRWEPRRIVRAA